MAKGKLLVIGFGPGDRAHMTERARTAIEESEVIIGYHTYVNLIRDLLQQQEIIQTGMTEEVSRALEAVRQAEAGKKVAVISSGDAGVYGMAGLIYEVLWQKGWSEKDGVEVEVIPGISAINSCASLLGAPVMHDACTISLSDHLTPWETIAQRLEAAARADFVIALYNPRSGRRTRQIEEAQRILLQYRPGGTPVGIVKSAYREKQRVVITTLDRMLEEDIGMLTTVIVGNSATFVYEGKMITPRGYQRKYTLSADEQPLQAGERLRSEHEPWSLAAQTDQPRFLAEEAVQRLQKGLGPAATKTGQALCEVALSPGVAKKTFSAEQMRVLAEIGEQGGEVIYTPDHYLLLRQRTDDANALIARLRTAGFVLRPMGAVIRVKACDFCDGTKKTAIPYAEELAARFDGQPVAKELHIAVNGCGMACYGAALEDIGVVYRQGAFTLLLGGKRSGKNAHAAQLVAEGIASEEIIEIVTAIVREYQEQAFPNEAFHKYCKRVGRIAGFSVTEPEGERKQSSLCGE